MPTPYHQLLPKRIQRLSYYLQHYRAIRPDSFDLDHNDIADALDCGLVRTDCVQHGQRMHHILLPGRNIRQICGTTDIIRPPVKGRRLQMALLADLALEFQNTGWEGQVDRRLRAVTAGYADHTYLIRPDSTKFENVAQNVVTIQRRTGSRVVIYVPAWQVEPLLAQFTTQFHKFCKDKLDAKAAAEAALDDIEILPFDLATWPPDVRYQS